jgi:hypothetical protein
MDIMIIVPKVVKSYLAKFPEVTHNAYPYFNFDHRVVEERVDRGDYKAPYKVADDFVDTDYDSLVKYAQTIINPILAKYNQRVANEDALHMAIRSFSNGLFDGKVNANRFDVLVKSMGDMKTAGKKKEKAAPKKEKPKSIPMTYQDVKQIGLKPSEIKRQPSTVTKRIPEDVHYLTREKGRIVTK